VQVDGDQTHAAERDLRTDQLDRVRAFAQQRHRQADREERLQLDHERGESGGQPELDAGEQRRQLQRQLKP
jgi:hypothetical protein